MLHKKQDLLLPSLSRNLSSSTKSSNLVKNQIPTECVIIPAINFILLRTQTPFEAVTIVVPTMFVESLLENETTAAALVEHAGADTMYRDIAKAFPIITGYLTQANLGFTGKKYGEGHLYSQGAKIVGKNLYELYYKQFDHSDLAKIRSDANFYCDIVARLLSYTEELRQKEHTTDLNYFHDLFIKRLIWSPIIPEVLAQAIPKGIVVKIIEKTIANMKLVEYILSPSAKVVLEFSTNYLPIPNNQKEWIIKHGQQLLIKIAKSYMFTTPVRALQDLVPIISKDLKALITTIYKELDFLATTHKDLKISEPYYYSGSYDTDYLKTLSSLNPNFNPLKEAVIQTALYNLIFKNIADPTNFVSLTLEAVKLENFANNYDFKSKLDMQSSTTEIIEQTATKFIADYLSMRAGHTESTSATPAIDLIKSIKSVLWLDQQSYRYSESYEATYLNILQDLNSDLVKLKNDLAVAEEMQSYNKTKLLEEITAKEVEIKFAILKDMALQSALYNIVFKDAANHNNFKLLTLEAVKIINFANDYFIDANSFSKLVSDNCETAPDARATCIAKITDEAKINFTNDYLSRTLEHKSNPLYSAFNAKFEKTWRDFSSKYWGGTVSEIDVSPLLDSNANSLLTLQTYTHELNCTPYENPCTESYDYNELCYWPAQQI